MDEAFALCYCMKGGITWSCIQDMEVAERERMLAKLWKQIKIEREENRKATAKARLKRGRRGRRR